MAEGVGGEESKVEDSKAEDSKAEDSKTEESKPAEASAKGTNPPESGGTPPTSDAQPPQENPSNGETQEDAKVTAVQDEGAKEGNVEVAEKGDAEVAENADLEQEAPANVEELDKLDMSLDELIQKSRPRKNESKGQGQGQGQGAQASVGKTGGWAKSNSNSWGAQGKESSSWKDSGDGWKGKGSNEETGGNNNNEWKGKDWKSSSGYGEKQGWGGGGGGGGGVVAVVVGGGHGEDRMIPSKHQTKAAILTSTTIMIPLMVPKVRTNRSTQTSTTGMRQEAMGSRTTNPMIPGTIRTEVEERRRTRGSSLGGAATITVGGREVVMNLLRDELLTPAQTRVGTGRLL